MRPRYKIDLFSDTNCGLSQGMRHSIMNADVGNEVAGEDPTVNLLLEESCKLLGKEAAVFMPSGTMCNGIGFRALCERPGDMILLDKTAHPLHKSSGLVAGLCHAVPCPLDGERGIFTVDQVRKVLERPSGYNISVPRVLSIEQPTNFGGGAIWPLKTIQDICQLASSYGLKTHMDGARLLNAVAVTGVSARAYAEPFDCVWIDFCKTLGAPMGAVLAGSQELIDKVWYYKFQQGGGMHKAGILAAGCLYGLHYNFSKLKEVHKIARLMGTLLTQVPYITLNPDLIETNIILFKVRHPTLSAYQIENFLAQKGIRIFAVDEQTIRLMTHLDIKEEDSVTVANVFSDLMQRG